MDVLEIREKAKYIINHIKYGTVYGYPVDLNDLDLMLVASYYLGMKDKESYVESGDAFFDYMEHKAMISDVLHPAGGDNMPAGQNWSAVLGGAR